MEGAGLKVTRHSQWISTTESEYIYFVNYVNTNQNLLENLFYRNPNLNWVGSFSCYIYVIIASIMILENIFFPVALIFLKFCHIEGNDCSRPDMKYFSVTIWWSAGHNLLCWYCWYEVVSVCSIWESNIGAALNLSPDWRKMPHILGSWRIHPALLR